MGKRKRTVPKQIDEAKRQLLRWNMNDPGTSSNGGLLHGDVTNETDQELYTVTETSSTHECFSDQSKCCDIKEFLDKSDFHLTINNHTKNKSTKPKIHIGNIELKLSMTTDIEKSKTKQLPECEELHLCINLNDSTHILCSENRENQGNSSHVKYNYLIFAFETDFPGSYFDLLRVKALEVTVDKMDMDNMTLLLRVNVFENALTKLQFSSEAKRMQKIDKCLQKLVGYWYQIDIPVVDENIPYVKKHDIEDVFLAIKNHHSNQNYEAMRNVQHSSLKPKLREYQRSAVKWMLSKEKIKVGDQPAIMLHPYYKTITTYDGTELHFNPHFGYLTAEKPIFVETPPGGILGDEMGLGKTVEVLACMLCHPRHGLEPVKPLPVVVVKEQNKTTNHRRKSKAEKQKLLVSKKRSDNVATLEDHSYCITAKKKKVPTATLR